jgi:hypothetical protein
MCGIVGDIGCEQAAPIVLSALKKLEYRGYDSAGPATITDSHIFLKKDAGTLAEVNTKHQLNELPSVARVYMDYREENFPEERLAAEPEPGSAVFTHAPEDGGSLELGVGLAQHIDGLIFEVGHVQHSSPLQVYIDAYNTSCILPTTTHISHRSCYPKWTADWRRYGYTGKYTAREKI